MYLWAHGKQEVWLVLSQSDFPRVFFEGDCSVEDKLQGERDNIANMFPNV